MLKKPFLMIPGPTPVPPQVLQALAQPVINHRGPEYAELQREILENLKWAFQTVGDVLIFPASGTGGLEAALVNVLSPGDKVLSVSIGVFGDRWAEIARRFGAEVISCNAEWGQPADPEAVAEMLRRHPETKAVLITHNETSTGVTNDLATLAKVVRQTEALLMVDAISALLATNLPTDQWGCDIVVAGSQKALMLPPGLTFLSVSARAWEAHQSARMPRFYWDFTLMKKYMERDQTPYTPAVNLLFGLREALRLLRSEGLPAIFERHRRLAEATRAGAQALGFTLLADPRYASNSVTALRVPAGIVPRELRRRLREKYGVIIAGGQGKLEGEVVRIGHLGWVSPTDLMVTLASLEEVLREMGHPVSPGVGIREFQKKLE